jgi:hypothetical protein
MNHNFHSDQSDLFASKENGISAEKPKIRVFSGETPWHRNWKKKFPFSFREVAHFDEHSRELHRADVFTPCGTTLEFQNSPISLKELASREAFYPKLVWILNGKKFKGFRILKSLPDVDDQQLADYEFCHSDHLCMFRKSDLMQGIQNPKRLNFYHSEIKEVKLTTYYYSFCWKHPHSVWYQAKAPIIIDLGGHFLYQLKQRKQLSGNYAYLHIMTRKSFVEQFIR